MKTESEIRELVYVLRYGRNRPCDCMSRGKVHEMQCVQGGRMMDSAIDALLWVLGDGGEINDRMLDMARDLIDVFRKRTAE